ncbi:MAG: hypothetical protein K9N49_09735 [Candidatus Marinimicrobia bacterium]|nr:hypothetical protein [Candidatus Neomarinimicrobiota bacterium]
MRLKGFWLGWGLALLMCGSARATVLTTQTQSPIDREEYDWVMAHEADGFSDAFEIFVLGTDPADPDSYGVHLSGAVSYDGPETGIVYVQPVTESAASWVKTWQASLTGDPVYVSFPMDYSITGLPPGEAVTLGLEPNQAYNLQAVSPANVVIALFLSPIPSEPPLVFAALRCGILVRRVNCSCHGKEWLDRVGGGGV